MIGSKVWQHCQTLLPIKKMTFMRNTTSDNIVKSGKLFACQPKAPPHWPTTGPCRGICGPGGVPAHTWAAGPSLAACHPKQTPRKNNQICSYRVKNHNWRNGQEGRLPIIDKPNDNQKIRTERIQVSHGRTIRVVSVFPENGRCSPEDKLKALIDLEIQQEKLCA